MSTTCDFICLKLQVKAALFALQRRPIDGSARSAVAEASLCSKEEKVKRDNVFPPSGKPSNQLHYNSPLPAGFSSMSVGLD